jgi:disulfide bond formation protein DsbB
MQPCPWCVLQRLIFVVIATLALMGAALSAVTRAPIARRVAAGLMLLGAVAGAAAALWQHFVASSSTSCNLTLADRVVSATGLDALLPDVFAAWASCADAAAKLLGLPYEVWSLTAFVVLGAVALRLLMLPARR